MTLSSSLNASVAGLAANASKLGTISDNIANSATYGYKRSVADFQSMVIGSNKGTYTAGGVRVTTLRLIDERGPLVTTNNSTDLAVRGSGMFPVTEITSVNSGNADDFPMRMSTTGSFRADQDGFMKTSSGLVLLGWPANADGTIPTYPRDSIGGLEPVRVNTAQFIADPTTLIGLEVNLPATETIASSANEPSALSVEYYDQLGLPQNIDMTFTPTPGPAATDVPSNEWTLTLEDSATIPATVGTFTLRFDNTPGMGGRLLGVDPVGSHDNTTGNINVPVGGGLGSTININLGFLGEIGGMTQVSDVFSPNVTKDGSPVGNMTNVEVDPNGFVNAFFDTGVSRTIYQIPLVGVSNPNGLGTQDFQSYSVTPESGGFYLWDAADGPTGDIVSYAREESATDVAGELTALIQTQRAYSSNAKVIQTVDEMLQETTNIKR